jgi:hypothetical protein
MARALALFNFDRPKTIFQLGAIALIVHIELAVP